MRRRFLLSCGIGFAVLYVAMLVFVPLQWPAYSSASQTVSELSAIGAPTRRLWFSLGLVYTLLVAAFGWGVWSAAGPKRALRIAGIVLIIQGVIGPFWPPMHLRGTETTLTDTLHVVYTAVNLLLTLLVIVLGATAHGKGFRLYSVVTIAVFIAGGTLTSLEAPNVAPNLPTPTIGVWERMNIAAHLLWVTIFSVTLLRADVRAGGKAG